VTLLRNNARMATSTERMRRLRERRAAGLIPVDGPLPLAEEDRLVPAVEESVAALGLGGEHAAAVQLARRYAEVIDQAENPVYALRWVGPLLLRVLTELQATPASRVGVRKPVPERPNQVQRLRAAHAQHPAVRRRDGA
jgi:hypothetical protein